MKITSLLRRMNIERFLLRLGRKVLVWTTVFLRRLPGGALREHRRYAAIERRLQRNRSSTSQHERLPRGLPMVESCVRQTLGAAEDYRVVYLRSPIRDDRDHLARIGIRERHLSHCMPVREAATGFQLDVLEAGGLQTPCPWTGLPLVSTKSVIAAESQPLFYRFDAADTDQTTFFMAVGREGHGYIRLYLYIPRHALVLFFAQRALWNGRGEIDQVRALMITHWLTFAPYFENDDRPRICALVDSKHFAHHLWEDVTGLAKLVRSGQLGRIHRLVVVGEPLMPIEILFPELPRDRIERSSYREVIERGLRENRILIRFGETRIKPDVIARLERGLKQVTDAATLARLQRIPETRWPVLWATIRTSNRTWVSQAEGIAWIVNELAQDYPRLALVIDGFCIPNGAPRIPTRTQTELVAQERRQAQTILARLAPTIPVHCTVGGTIAHSLAYASIADIYLAHHGSLQHKIAWVRNCPGVVHSNRGVLASPLENYPGLFARTDAILPVYLAPEDVQDQQERPSVANLKWDYDLENYELDPHRVLVCLRHLIEAMVPRSRVRRAHQEALNGGHCVPDAPYKRP